MDLHRFGFKLFVQDPAREIDPDRIIRTFHRWIQTHAVEGLLIDVADYTQVPEGPGIMLIAHEGNYALDDAVGDRGLLYMRKRPMEGDLRRRLTEVCRATLDAAHKLEEAPELEGAIRFPGNRLQFIANDRLLAPNDDETRARLQPEVETLLGRLYGNGGCEIQAESDRRERFQLHARAPEPVTITTLLERLGNAE